MEKKSPPTPPRTAPRTDPVPTVNPEIVIERTTNRPKFVKGNSLWQLAKNPGRRLEIATAADLWQLAINYFKWCDENPQARAEVIKHMGEGELIDVPLGRPYSIDAFTIFAGVSGAYFRQRKIILGDKEDAKTATTAELDMLDTILLIESVVRSQRFEGAAVGIFKENLISRVDGYADHMNQNNTGEVRQNIVVRDQATADNLKALDDMLK